MMNVEYEKIPSYTKEFYDGLFFPLLFAILSIGSPCYGSDEFSSAKAWENYFRNHEKEEEGFRIYDETTPEHVKKFYRLNHARQTLEFVLKKEEEYLPPRKKQMGIWEAIAFFDTLVDGSDPDLDLPQRYHLFQTAEALRKDGQPRWLVLTGFLHDLGKGFMQPIGKTPINI